MQNYMEEFAVATSGGIWVAAGVELWKQLSVTLAEQLPIVPGDYAVAGAHYVPPASPVNVPARIHYTLLSDHVFYRTDRGKYPDICRQLLASGDFSGENFSAGDRRIYRCANAIETAGGPADRPPARARGG